MIDQTVDVRLEEGRVVIEPVATPSYTLEKLLGQTDPATFLDDWAAGRPQGNEVW